MYVLPLLHQAFELIILLLAIWHFADVPDAVLPFSL